MTVDHPNYIFFISHYLDPFFLYCLSNKLWLPILIILIWELIEFIIFEIEGNYSVLFLQENNGEIEPFTDFFIYDIVGGTFSVIVGYLFFKLFSFNKVILNIKDIFQPTYCSGFSKPSYYYFILKTIILSPFASIGWVAPDLLKDFANKVLF